MEDPRWPMTNVVSRRQAAAILPTLVMKAAAAVAAAGGGAGGAAVWTSIQGRCGSSLPKTVKPLHTEDADYCGDTRFLKVRVEGIPFQAARLCCSPWCRRGVPSSRHSDTWIASRSSCGPTTARCEVKAAAPSPSRIPSRTSARRLAERLRCDHSNSEYPSHRRVSTGFAFRSSAVCARAQSLPETIYSYSG
uniref:Uncharacterized protein LOC116948517 isoform X2 n=1 Tax=Petromyzon marinus TaxID=7757 RepID=A0AAJ7X5U6_PETMA|nr:uncharacterized protein LOC116948517 isoform X2 [Petromyzon marinus]